MSEVRARVFISHSTKTPGSEAYLNAVKDGLKNAGYEAFVDSDVLLGGDDWRSAIYRFLDEAHAAVLLISDEAQSSSWVGIEASILTFLAYRQGFKVIPVMLVPALPDGMLKDVIGGTTIRQLVIPKSPADACKQVLRALDDPAFKEIVRASMPARLTREAFIADELEAIGFGRTALAMLPPAAGDAPQSDRAACERVARVLAGASFADACTLLKRINRVLAKGKSGYAPRLVNIVDRLKPNWVSQADAVLAIARARAENEAQRTLAVGAPTEFAIESLVRRAHGSPVDVLAKVLFLVDQHREDTLKDFTEQLGTAFRTARKKATGKDDPRWLLRPPDEAEVRASLTALESETQPVIVVFPPGWPVDVELVADVRTAFPSLALVFVDAPAVKTIKPPVVALRALDPATASAAESQYDDVIIALPS